MCCKAVASASAPEEQMLFSENAKKERKSKPPKSKLNKEELCCKAEANASATEEPPILLPEEDKRKGNYINSSSIKKNCVVKQKQVLVYLKSKYY